MLPQDWVILNSPFENSTWRKISGPANYIISYTNSEYTAIKGLVEGSYQFELISGSVIKDTANVNVYDVSIIPENAKEIIIENVKWIFPLYATLSIPNFYDKIPRESLFRIFVKRDGNENWEDVPGNSNSNYLASPYEYFIERRLPDGAGMYTNGSLLIFYYGRDTFDTPDLKVVYW